MAHGFLQSVDNALRVVELLSGENPELGVSEISKSLNLGKSTVHRLLITLERRGLIVQNPATSKYKLGIKIVHLGAGVLRQLNIIHESRPYLGELSRITGESAHLALYSQGEITFVDKVTGNKVALMGSTIGLKKPAYCTATGKVLLANLSKNEQEEYLERVDLLQFTPNTIKDVKELRRQLLQIKSNGHAEDQQESEEGLVCFAAPIRDISGTVIAAASVSGAASRMNEHKQTLVPLVKNTAQNISQACGWRPDCKVKSQKEEEI